MEIIHKPVAHGVGWPGDVKKIALNIEMLKSLGFRPRMNGMESVKEAARHFANES